MEITLSEKISKPTIIEGFPGYGLIGTISTEFLIRNLNAKRVGHFWFDEVTPSVAIHEGKMIHPVGIYHAKKHNFLIIHSIVGTPGIEWKAAKMITDLAKQTNAGEILCIEGVGAANAMSEESNIFFHTNDKKAEQKMLKLGIKELKEGIIVGVTSAVLMTTQRKMTAIFAETHSALPDSKAAAKAVEMIDKYLGIKLDTRPLLNQADELESKLKEIIQKNQSALDQKEKKQLNYVG